RRAVRSTPAHEPVEGAELSVSLLFLIQERQPTPVELAEELVPLDRLHVAIVLVVVAGKRDPQEARVVLAARALDVSRPTASFLVPAANLVVVRRSLRFAHRLDLRVDVEALGSKIHAERPSRVVIAFAVHRASIRAGAR